MFVVLEARGTACNECTSSGMRETRQSRPDHVFAVDTITAEGIKMKEFASIKCICKRLRNFDRFNSSKPGPGSKASLCPCVLQMQDQVEDERKVKNYR